MRVLVFIILGLLASISHPDVAICQLKPVHASLKDFQNLRWLVGDWIVTSTLDAQSVLIGVNTMYYRISFVTDSSLSISSYSGPTYQSDEFAAGLSITYHAPYVLAQAGEGSWIAVILNPGLIVFEPIAGLPDTFEPSTQNTQLSFALGSHLTWVSTMCNVQEGKLRTHSFSVASHVR